jgi:hypothetical protein
MRADVARTGATHWVEKTPDHVFHVERMMARYPDARFVHVLRDGRDVVTSLLAFPSIVPHARTRSARLLAGCALWEWMALAGMRAHRNAVRGGRFGTIRYEDVVRAPRSSLRSLLDWAGVPAGADHLATVHRELESGRGNSSYEPDAAGVYGTAIGRWRDPGFMSDEERAVVEWLVRPTLTLAGYSWATPGDLALSGRAPERSSGWVRDSPGSGTASATGRLRTSERSVPGPSGRWWADPEGCRDGLDS